MLDERKNSNIEEDDEQIQTIRKPDMSRSKKFNTKSSKQKLLKIKGLFM